MILLLALHETDSNHSEREHRCFVKGKFYNRTGGKLLFFFSVARGLIKKNQVI